MARQLLEMEGVHETVAFSTTTGVSLHLERLNLINPPRSRSHPSRVHSASTVVNARITSASLILSTHCTTFFYMWAYRSRWSAGSRDRDVSTSSQYRTLTINLHKFMRGLLYPSGGHFIFFLSLFQGPVTLRTQEIDPAVRPSRDCTMPVKWCPILEQNSQNSEHKKYMIRNIYFKSKSMSYVSRHIHVVRFTTYV